MQGDNYLYSRTHEWVRVEGEKAYIGITDYAQHHLGDIVFVEMPELDVELKAGEQLAVIESVKTVETVFAPLSGKVIELNHSLEDSPELLNEAPFEQHIAVIAFSDGEELKNLLNAEAYAELCKEEE
mgnify:CR=1 FL=1